MEWGTVIWVKDLHAGKLNPRAKEGQFIEYHKESKGYRIYWPCKNKVSVERNVYADKRSVIDPGNDNIEGEWETVKKPDNLNPTIPNQISDQPITNQQENIPKTNIIIPPVNPSEPPVPLVTETTNKN